MKDETSIFGAKPERLDRLVLEALQDEERAQDLMDRYLGEPDILLYAVRHAIQSKDYSKAKLLADQGRRKKLRPTVQAKLEETLLHIAEAEEDTEAIIHLSAQRLLQSYDIDYVANIKAISGDDWPQYQQQIIQQLRNRPYSREREELIGQIYAREQQWEALLQHLAKMRSLEVLRHFDEYLLPAHRKEVYDEIKGE